MATYVVSGLAGISGTKVRREINEWWAAQDEDSMCQHDLFIQALQNFCNTDPHTLTSYYQVAGIHGQPYISWDEAQHKPETADEGYCTHNSTLFATWHRPYMALYEQLLYENMKGIVPLYPADLQAKYTTAMNNWRFPYWAWGEYQDIPDLLTLPTVSIRTAANKGNVDPNFPNPTYKFECPGPQGNNPAQFGDKSWLGDLALYDDNAVNGQDTTSAFDLARVTNRWPPSYDNGQDPVAAQEWQYGNDVQAANATVNQQLKTNDPQEGRLPYWVAHALLRKDWDGFATTLLADGDAGNGTSLEMVHNAVHGYVGGPGFMGDIAYAAFDPIFWLHHCYIDKLLETWLQLHPGGPSHPEQWFDIASQQLADPGNYYIPAGTKPTPEDPLHPFYKSQTELWSSNDIKDPEVFGYTYPIIPIAKKDGPDTLASAERKDVVKYVNAVHNPLRKVFLGRPDLGSVPDAPADDDGERFVEHEDYVVKIIYKRSDMGGKSYWIHLFLGSTDRDNVAGWRNSDTNIGQYYTFTQGSGYSEESGCANCKKQDEGNVLSVAAFPISIDIIRAASGINVGAGFALTEENREAILLYLRENLSWSAQHNHPVAVQPTDVPNLKLELHIGKGRHYESDEILSTFEDYNHQLDVKHISET